MAKKAQCIFLMQKNERHLLPLFFKYHSKIVGPENIFIFDNGSDESMGPTLRLLQDLGAKVVFDYSSRDHFETKGKLFSEFVKDLKAEYSTFIPLDCDEFLALELKSDLAVEPGLIKEELQALKPGIAKVSGRWRAHPSDIGLITDGAKGGDLPKLLFCDRVPQDLDLGFHYSVGSSCAQSTKLSYLEFHFRPLKLLKKMIAQKMESRVDEAGKPIFSDGRGHHLLDEMAIETDREYQFFLDKLDWRPSYAQQHLLNLLEVDSMFADNGLY